MDADFLKREAERLLNDTVLKEALARIRSQALETLARCEASNSIEIARLQAHVAVCDGMQAELQRMVMSASEKRPFKAV